MPPRRLQDVQAEKPKRQRGRKPSAAPRRRKKPGASPVLERLNLNAAGIDVGAECHYVAVPADRDDQAVRRFGAFTMDLHAIAVWLKQCQIDTVALESTGVYWIPLVEVLEEEGFEVLLVDPHKIKHVPGRKTDVLDCQWIQELHSLGLLTSAFRPSGEFCSLRSYSRQRDMLITGGSDHVRRMQKALTEMNIKLTEVLSNITGMTGMKIIRAILAGERDPLRLAQLRDGRCRNSEETIALALEGNWRDEHLFALRQAVEAYDFCQGQIADCDREIEAQLASMPARRPDLPPLETRPKGHASHPLAFGGYEHLHRIAGIDVTQLPGLDAPSVLGILSEVGTDMTKWRHDKAFASWLAVCPGSKVTGGKRLSSRSRRSANRAAKLFRLAAYGLQHSNTYLGAHYRRMKARLGAPKAITATAHKLARIFYAMMRDGTEYVEKGPEYYEKRYRERAITNLKRNARRLGYQVVPGEAAAVAAAA